MSCLLVGGLSLKAASRRFDIEMKDVWYVVAKTENGKTTYTREKASIPMLFVQREQVDSFGEDMIGANSAQFDSAPALSPAVSLTVLNSLYKALLNDFVKVKEQMSYGEIVEYIGDKNSFFDKQT